MDFRYRQYQHFQYIEEMYECECAMRACRSAVVRKGDGEYVKRGLETHFNLCTSLSQMQHEKGTTTV